jgi:hypothetical protein
MNKKYAHLDKCRQPGPKMGITMWAMQKNQYFRSLKRKA